MLKPLFGLAAIVIVTAPAFAAEEFYIVRGADKQCQIVEERPTTTTTIIVGDEDGYDSREQAVVEMRRICRPKTDSDDDDND